MTDFQRIGIVGAGAWGTALANAIASKHRAVVLYARDPAVADEMKTSRTNAAKLPGVALSPEIVPTNSLGEAADADVILLAVPTQSLREISAALAPTIRASLPVVACAKGIERGTQKFVTEIIKETIPLAQTAILSGPSFASDVGRGLPTAVTLAAADERLAADLAEALSSPTFRLYHSTDVRGVEIGGAAKNVLAIAAGIVLGRGLGASAQAALITRGLRRDRAARPRLRRKAGNADGPFGPRRSHPHLLVAAVTKLRARPCDRARPAAESRATPLAEGAFTAPVLADIALKKQVEMPIVSAVEAILAKRVNVETAISALLSRPLKGES